MSERPRKLLDQVADAIRRKHYSYRTEQTYVQWIKRFILFHQKRHPAEMNTPEIEAFLTDLAVNRTVSASTQNQAFAALLFLYREVLHIDLLRPIDALRAKPSQHLGLVKVYVRGLATLTVAPNCGVVLLQALTDSSFT